MALLRTAREALTNAARHAPGEPVTMTLAYLPAGVRLTVSNALVGAFAKIGARNRTEAARYATRLGLTH
ncbi:hypothetical protein [Actinoplanes sp. CA-252034]|uniref:hypothetical protein n=1 Tax=Actinoplanes sp. CA-252034 TaxID=3239906 RepID=UPI003D971A83